MPSLNTFTSSRTSTASDRNMQASRASSNSLPLMSERRSLIASATRVSIATWPALPMLVRAMWRPPQSSWLVRLPYSTDEAVADHVEQQRQEEQHDADEVEAGEREPRAGHVVAAGGERRHRCGHREAALQRIRGVARRRGGTTGDEHDHRLPQ